MRLPRVTLLGAFVAALAVMAVLLGALAAVVLEGSRRSILTSAEKLRDAAARRVEAQVRAQLAVVPLLQTRHVGLRNGHYLSSSWPQPSRLHTRTLIRSPPFPSLKR